VSSYVFPVTKSYKGCTRWAKGTDKQGNHWLERRRPFGDQRVIVSKDEYEWADNVKRMNNLWYWHYAGGLHQNKPHPIGWPLEPMKLAYNDYHAQRYRKAGMEVPGCYLNKSAPMNQQPEEV